MTENKTQYKTENGVELKLCPKCSNWKKLPEYSKSKNCHRGLFPYCKKCKSDSDKSSRNRHLEARMAKVKAYHEENRDEINAARRSKRLENPEYFKKQHKEYRDNNKEKIAKSKEKYYQKNKKKLNAEWAIKRRTNLNERIKNNLRARLNKALKGMFKFSSTVDVLGCSLLEFREHIESQFTEGMTWENYGRNGWHLDHIKPCFLFDLTKEDQQVECFNYKNMQPLWAKDNMRKNKYYDDPSSN